MSSPRQDPDTNKVRKPTFAYWPGIKIYNPPSGPFSTKTDEWCITYCTQSIGGRVHRKIPSCRSVCIRKVFPHEVRNIISFKQHQEIGPDGKAKYPLPVEGQPANLPRIFGGKPPIPEGHEDGEHHGPDKKPDTRYWDEGWYIWSSSSFYSTMQKTYSMSLDLDAFRRQEERRERDRRNWIEFDMFLERNASLRDSGRLDGPPEGEDRKWFGIRPPNPVPPPVDTDSTILLPVSSETFTLLERMNKFLDPTRKLFVDYTQQYNVRGTEEVRAQVVGQNAVGRAVEACTGDL